MIIFSGTCLVANPKRYLLDQIRSRTGIAHFTRLPTIQVIIKGLLRIPLDWRWLCSNFQHRILVVFICLGRFINVCCLSTDGRCRQRQRRVGRVGHGVHAAALPARALPLPHLRAGQVPRRPTGLYLVSNLHQDREDL